MKTWGKACEGWPPRRAGEKVGATGQQGQS